MRDGVLVQVSYAIGAVTAYQHHVNTYGTAGCSDDDRSPVLIMKNAPLRYAPLLTEKRLRNCVTRSTAKRPLYGHMGRRMKRGGKDILCTGWQIPKCKVELFTWGKLDAVKECPKLLKLK